MHVTGMTVGPGSHPAFEEDFDLQFDEGVNLFIGANACGKTSLLRVIASAFRQEQTSVYRYTPEMLQLSDDWLPNLDDPTQSHLANSLHGNESDSDRVGHKWTWAIPCVYIPATRIILPSDLDWDDVKLSISDRESLDKKIDWKEHAYIFDGTWVTKVYKYLYDKLDNAERDASRVLVRTARRAHSCAAEISSEVLTGRASNYVSDKDRMIASDNDDFDPLMEVPYIHPGLGVIIKNGQFGDTDEEFAGNLSAGTQGALLWIWYIALRIMHHYESDLSSVKAFLKQYGEDWENMPAILLIDEIENHLHPTWQRRVIPALRKYFPNVQIFATTHSPFVVAGLKAGQVHMLKREANGVVTASTNEHDIIGWTTDEILRTFMGVDEPTDQLTVERANRLRELRGKDELSPEEADELERLRRQVNEDFMASSTPLEAQRERYGDMMLEFLRSRQSDLSQDGS